MEEFNVNTPEGLKRFLLAEAELDNNLYSEQLLKGYLKNNKLNSSEYDLLIPYLKPLEA